MKNIIPNHPKFWLTLILAFFLLLFMIAAIGNHYYFRTYALDYATYNFAFYDYSHLRISHCPLYEIWGDHRGTFFQDHFSLTIFYFVPFYWMLNWLTGSYTLLILQTLLIVISGWAVFKFVSTKTANDWLGLFAVLSYFLLQGRYSAFTGDVNIGIISPCFIPFFLHFVEKKKFINATIIFVLAIFSRENMSLWFIFISIVQLFWYKKDHPAFRYCLAYLVSSFVFFLLLFLVFIPMIEIPEKKYTLFTFSALGNTPLQALNFMLTNPIKTIKLLFINHLNDRAYDGVKLEFYLIYLVSGGFLLLIRPVYVIWLIPAIAFKMFNDSPIRWSVEWYYSLDIVTLVSISAALIIAEIKKTARFKALLCLFIVLLTTGVTIEKSNSRNREMAWWGTVKECVWKPAFFNSPYDIKKFNRALKQIPGKSSLSASETLLPHLSQRDSIYYFPNIGPAKYIAFLTDKKDNYLVSEEEYKNTIAKYLDDPLWVTVINDYPLIILKKK